MGLSRRAPPGLMTGIYTSFLPYAKVNGEVGLISCYGTSCMDKESISTYYAKGTIRRVLNRTKDYWLLEWLSYTRSRSLSR